MITHREKKMLTDRQMFIHMFILVLKTMPQMTYLFANYDQNRAVNFVSILIKL